MAQLRVIVLGVLTACRAEASPGSGVAPPPGWHAQPGIATAVANAANTDGVTVDGCEAWAEPAMGCYGVWLGMHGHAGTPDTLAQRALDALGREHGLEGTAISNIVMPSASAQHLLTFNFKRAAYEGMTRVQLAESGQSAMLACFWNEREPRACRTSCVGMMEKFQ